MFTSLNNVGNTTLFNTFKQLSHNFYVQNGANTSSMKNICQNRILSPLRVINAVGNKRGSNSSQLCLN